MSNKRAIQWGLFLLLSTSLLSGIEINIHDAVNLVIPDEIEVLSVSQNLRSHNKSDQYCLRVYIEMIYDNTYLPLKIDLFGYGDTGELAEKLDMEKVGIYSPEYRTADQKKYLKQNYAEYPERTENIEFSRFVSHWPNGWSSDYYGIYFKLENSFFDEAIVSMINIWSGFGGSGLKINDREFREKAQELSASGRRFLAMTEAMIRSIECRPGVETNKSLLFSSYEDIPGYFLPTIENLRLRSGPSPDSEVLGYVSGYPHLIIGTGPEFEADGIKGQMVQDQAIHRNDDGLGFQRIHEAPGRRGIHEVF